MSNNTQLRMDLKGKTVFITGAAQGLGKEHITALLKKGAKIFFCDLNGEKGQETASELGQQFGSENVKFAQADVTDRAQFEAVFKQAVSQYGQIDIMINNAAILDDGRWELSINLNLFAVVIGTKLATEHMRKDKGGKGGRIINVSSAAGLWDRYAWPVYCATKHGVRSYTSSLSMQPNLLEEQGVEYALLCPEAAATDLILKLDTSKTDYYTEMSSFLSKQGVMRPERVAEALLDLVQRETMNGIIQYVSADAIKQKALQVIDV